MSCPMLLRPPSEMFTAAVLFKYYCPVQICIKLKTLSYPKNVNYFIEQ